MSGEWISMTGYSEKTMGVFKGNKPPVAKEDILMHIQAITWRQKESKEIEGHVLAIDIESSLGVGPFDITIYSQTRKRPYTIDGYHQKRTLKNVVLSREAESGEQLVRFAAEADTDWEALDFLYEETGE